MNKIFQLCFMFSQEIYIKLKTLPSQNTEFLIPVIFCFLEYFILSPCLFVMICLKLDQRFCDNNNWLFLCNYHRTNKPKINVSD